jgi:hypothetical protein
MRDDQLVTLRRYLNPLEAELDRARLEAEGIPAFLQDTAIMSLSTTDSPGVRLQVAAADEARAREALEAGAGEVVDPPSP